VEQASACVANAKNRFPHAFGIFIFVEAAQHMRFYKKYKLWKSRLPHGLFSLWGLVLAMSKTHRLKPVPLYYLTSATCERVEIVPA
jgi:hypothetical protein